MYWPPPLATATRIGCSSDLFAIRPSYIDVSAAVTTDNTWLTAGATRSLASANNSATANANVTANTDRVHAAGLPFNVSNLVASTAESLARDYARRARGAGHSWDEVAAALKFDAAGHDDPSVDAFYWVAPTPSQPFDSIVTSWECASCAARVTDRGPFGGHPEEVEEGHLDSCARHQEDISAYRQQTGWDD